MDGLDRWLPEFDARERHERSVGAPDDEALAALLATPVACDRLTRTLLAVRGIRAGRTPIRRLFDGRFEVLEESPTVLVLAGSAQPWRLRGGVGPFRSPAPGTVRIAVDFRAVNGLLSTETRVAATDDQARRAFRRYWFVVGPFSALIRRRWLAAASRAIASANRSTAPAPSSR